MIILTKNVKFIIDLFTLHKLLIYLIIMHKMQNEL